MNPEPIRCLILACGNPLRGDDGVGPWLAARAVERYRGQPDVRVITRQQWHPELAAEIAQTDAVLFLDSSAKAPPGSVDAVAVEPAASSGEWTTHHLDARELLALSRDLYASLPHRAVLLTVGIASVDLGEELSEIVRAAVPHACQKIDRIVLEWRKKKKL